MEVMSFKCTQKDCGFIGLTRHQLMEHTEQKHPTPLPLPLPLPLPSQDTYTISGQTLAQGEPNIHTMSLNELAQFLAKLDTNFWNELLYKVYTIKTVEQWNGIS